MDSGELACWCLSPSIIARWRSLSEIWATIGTLGTLCSRPTGLCLRRVRSTQQSRVHTPSCLPLSPSCFIPQIYHRHSQRVGWRTGIQYLLAFRGCFLSVDLQPGRLSVLSTSSFACGPCSLSWYVEIRTQPLCFHFHWQLLGEKSFSKPSFGRYTDVSLKSNGFCILLRITIRHFTQLRNIHT